MENLDFRLRCSKCSLFTFLELAMAILNSVIVIQWDNSALITDTLSAITREGLMVER